MNRFLCLLLLVGLAVSAQVKGIVVDENDKPIPYVNIWTENQNAGATTDENGQFEIKTLGVNKSLIFSSLGFETQKVDVSEAVKVVLKPAIIDLPEVIVSKPKQTREIEIGSLKKAVYLPEPQMVPWIFAIRMKPDENNKELKYVKSITYYTKSEVKEGKFRVRVFSANEDGSPNEDLLSEEVIVTVQKGRHKTLVDVSKYGLVIPNEGIVVGFESLLIEENRYTEDGLVVNTNKKAYYQDYSPRILYNYIDTEESYAFKAGIWTKQLFRWFTDNGKGKRVIAPAIQLTLTN